MGSSKKHKKHKSERRERYEEYSNNMDPANLQRGLKLILKVGSNSTPEYSGNSPHTAGPPTAAEAMLAAAPSSPAADENDDGVGGHNAQDEEEHGSGEYRCERHKKSKKKKKKKDREKKHKHHKEKRHHRSERHERHRADDACEPDEHQHPSHAMDTPVAHTAAVSSSTSSVYAPQQQQQQLHRSPKSIATPLAADCDSSQDGFSFIDDDNSQPPLPENILFYAGITTDNSPSCRPVSKPIVARKCDDELIMLGSSPASSQQSSASMGFGGGGSPTKPLPDLLIPSPSPSTATASTPGGGVGNLTPKNLDIAPKTPSSSSESGREPRTCVLKLKQHKNSPLNKLLAHLLRSLEKRDPHQFFAWPVTDAIAPGYSSIISKPMDFSTMRQKIDDNDYAALTEFTDDFRLMCENAIRYNHVDTVYHKAAKRLLQVGMKHLQPESLMRSLKPMSGYMRELTAKELGFDLLDFGGILGDYSADEGASTEGADEPTSTPAQLEEEAKRRTLRLANEPKTRFEPFVDDLTSEEILAQVQGAARTAKKRLSTSARDNERRAHKMGFLRQHKDGTTSLNLLIKDENEGPEKVVSLGDLVGKLESGCGQLQGLREDRRNDTKMPKNLNYGAFASFAPVFDSRFSNLSKEQTQLVLRTYGDATSSEYAESILQFTKDSSYASMLANRLLDILTHGDHSKAISDLYDMQVQDYEQAEMQKCFTNEQRDPENVLASSSADGDGNTTRINAAETRAQIEQDYEKYKNTRIDFTRLRTLNDLGIDVGFLDSMEHEMKNFELTRRLQEHLSNNLNLIEKLRATQHDRLSQPLPAHLAHVSPAGAEETHIAQQITQQLTDLAKKLPPAAIADPFSLRKAMGMSFVGLPAPPQPLQRLPVPELLQQPVAMPQLHLPSMQQTASSSASSAAVITIPDDASSANVSMDIDEDIVGAGGVVGGSSSGVDLENELREFLESGPGLHATASSSADENNIVAQLLLN